MPSMTPPMKKYITYEIRKIYIIRLFFPSLRMEDTERWVQCSKCQKWRCVPDCMKIHMNQDWECKYNVFSSTHNNCNAEQEKMDDHPPAAAAAADDDDDDDTDIVFAEDTELFTPSSCTCATCTAINTAVDTWPTDTPTHPLLHIIHRAITKTEPIAAHFEDDKKFLLG